MTQVVVKARMLEKLKDSKVEVKLLLEHLGADGQPVTSSSLHRAPIRCAKS
jgi:hypothetical protein